MIVLDASVVVELLTNSALAETIRGDLHARSDSFIVPHLLDVEVVSAVRGLAAVNRIDFHSAARIVEELETLPVERFEHTPLLRRVWELRHNFTAYDAVYIAWRRR